MVFMMTISLAACSMSPGGGETAATTATTAAPAADSGTAAPNDAAAETPVPEANTPAADMSGVAVEALKFPEGKTWKVGIATRDLVSDFNQGIMDSAVEVFEQAGGEVVIADGQTDPEKHNQNIENLINSDIDALMIELGSATQLEPIVAKAAEKGIPVVTAAVTAHTPGTIGDVSGDDSLMGVLNARALLASIGFKGDVYVIWVPGAPLLEARKAAFEAVASCYPAVTIHEVPSEHNAAKVQTQIEEILVANPNPGSVAAIWSSYDVPLNGAFEVVRTMGRDEIKLGTMGGDRTGFQMLMAENSPLVSYVAQDVYGIGRKAAQNLLLVVNGRADEVQPMTFAGCIVANVGNAVEAAELRFGTGYWELVGLNKDESLALYPALTPAEVVEPIIY